MLPAVVLLLASLFLREFPSCAGVRLVSVSVAVRLLLETGSWLYAVSISYSGGISMSDKISLSCKSGRVAAGTGALAFLNYCSF